MLKWEKVHQTLSGLLNRHRFSLIRVNFPVPFSEEQKKQNKMCCFCFLVDFWLSESGKLCVCAVPLGRYEIRHGGDAQLKPRHSTSFPPCRFYFWLSSNLFEPLKGWSFHRLQAQTTAAADSIISLGSFTHTVYVYCCLFPSQRWKRWRGGEDSSILLRWTNLCRKLLFFFYPVRREKKRGEFYRFIYLFCVVVVCACVPFSDGHTTQSSAFLHFLSLSMRILEYEMRKRIWRRGG